MLKPITENTADAWMDARLTYTVRKLEGIGVPWQWFSDRSMWTTFGQFRRHISYKMAIAVRKEDVLNGFKSEVQDKKDNL